MESVFAIFCERVLDLKKVNYYGEYKSLPVCLIDCVYSLRAKYFAVTVPVVQRYANRYLHGNKYAEGPSLTEFAKEIEATGFEGFAAGVLNNRQKLSGRLKSQVTYDVAKSLLSLGIQSKEDFAQYPNPRLLEYVISGVRGIGPAGLNYLFMLAGDPNRCKPDTHIHQAIRDGIGHDVSDAECQIIFSDAVKELRTDYPDLTVRRLDGLIWEKYQG